VGGCAANAAVSEFANEPPTPDPSPPRAKARGGRGEVDEFKFQTATAKRYSGRHCDPLARNDGETQIRIPAARFARVLLCSFRPLVQRAQGMPGAWCARSRACSVVNTRVSHHGHTGNARHSPRNGFNGFLRALSGDRALLPPSFAIARKLKRQRRGVRTTRLRRPHQRHSSKAPPRPPHPASRP